MYIWTVYPGLYIYMDCIHGKWTVYMVSFWFHYGFIYGLYTWFHSGYGFIRYTWFHSGLYILDCIYIWTVYMVNGLYTWFHSGFILVSYMDCIHGFILVSFMYIWTVYRIYNTKRACLLFPVSSMYIWTVSCELYVYLCISGHNQGLSCSSAYQVTVTFYFKSILYSK